jgi:hypothetical protein
MGACDNLISHWTFHLVHGKGIGDVMFPRSNLPQVQAMAKHLLLNDKSHWVLVVLVDVGDLNNPRLHQLPLESDLMLPEFTPIDSTTSSILLRKHPRRR